MNLVDIEVIELSKKINDLEIFINNFKMLPFYKKIFEKKKLRDIINDITSNYFTRNDNNFAKQLISSISFLKTFLPYYQNFIGNKTIYDKLD